MIMKLYIPTTTLNFNNILSSETISPKAFYGIRGYGYKRWEPVAENCLENGILLYKKPFSFTRPANGLDDYPMLIEIEMDEDEVAEFEPCGDWGYKSRHSLSLTPVTTRFIFFSEKDKRIALSKSEASAETKLTRLYDGKLSVENYAEDMQKHEVLDWEKPDYKALEDDKRLNKIKGFAYGYVIGRMLSRTETDVIKLNARYSVRDIVASVISSGEGIATKEQEKVAVLPYEKSVCKGKMGRIAAMDNYGHNQNRGRTCRRLQYFRCGRTGGNCGRTWEIDQHKFGGRLH